MVDLEDDEWAYVETLSDDELADLLATDSEESTRQLWKSCIRPTLTGTLNSLLKIIIITAILQRISIIIVPSSKWRYFVPMFLGVYILYEQFDRTILILLLIFAGVGCLIRLFASNLLNVVAPIVFILCCQFWMPARAFMKCRGTLMIMAMKMMSLREAQNASQQQCLSYLLNGASVSFGPRVPFLTYKRCVEQRFNIKALFQSVLTASQSLLISISALIVSTCLIDFLLNDQLVEYEIWLQAYRTAISFRFSHYFVCFFGAAAVELAYGDSVQRFTVTKMSKIELPRSLVQVVSNWNISMHMCLKDCVFKPLRRRGHRTITAILGTYIVSSLLHGINFQIAAVLLSLGLYTYAEQRLRNRLSIRLNACVEVTKCESECNFHEYSEKHIWVSMINISFFLLSSFHLLYLGAPFTIDSLQEIGYNYKHTISTWANLHYSSHLIALFTLLLSFVI